MATLDDILISVGLRDNTGRPTARVQRNMDAISDAGKKVGKALSSALSIGPALAAPAAAAGALASTLGGAAVAAGALGAAVGPQVAKVQAASDAYDTYAEAVRQSGEGSKGAKTALAEYKAQLDEMPAATQATAKEFIGLKSDFAAWSDSLAGDSMPLFTRGLEFLRDLLPKLTPLAKGAADVFSDFADDLAKEFPSKGIDSFMKRLTAWSLGGLKKVTDGVIWFIRKIKEIRVNPAFQSFLANTEGSGGNAADILKKLAQFAGEFIEAAGPFAGLSFKALEILADVLNAIPEDLLKILAPTILAIAAAIKIYNLALAAYALYQWAANAALMAFPITWIVAAIIAVIAIVILLVLKRDWVKAKLLAIWKVVQKGLKAGWDWMVANVFAPIGRFFTQTIPRWAGMLRDRVVGAWNSVKNGTLSAVGSTVDWVKNKWNGMVSFFSSIPGRIAKGAKGMWSFVTDGLKSALNGAIGLINDGIYFINDNLISNANRLPGVNIPWIPYVPYLAEGGITTGPTMAMIGEGSEQEAVLPLSKLEAMINVGAARGSTGKVQPVSQRLILELKGGSRAFREFLQESVQNTTGGDIVKYVRG
jgi:hypothetical protein